MKDVEIERKWLMDGFPAGLALEQEMLLEQGYLAFEPNTVRIRCRLGDEGPYNCRLTFKSGGTLKRREVELDISPEKYEALKPLLAAPTARKRLRLYKLPGGETLECSLVDEGEPTGFAYAEVEFDSVEQAEAFAPPAYLGREVTEEPGHSMAAYCRKKTAKGGFG